MMHLFTDILRNSILITGLVVVMMMMIESLNIESRGLIFKGLRKTRIGQVVIGALLGSIPGCMGGFATVSLYTHRMFSFGALVAMMIASSGDEAFIMLAMIPEQALVLFAVLFVIAVVVGVLVDIIGERFRFPVQPECNGGYVVHDEETAPDSHKTECHDHHHCHTEDRKRGPAIHFGWKRIVMMTGLAVFIAVLGGGHLEHSHGTVNEDTHVCHEHHSECHGCHTNVEDNTAGFSNLLDEKWMHIIFAGLSILVLLVLIFASDHFVEEHLWEHIIKKHLPIIFAWTFGVLTILGIGLQYVEIDRWISTNTALMILLATLIGIIPESGPHLIFVTLFATGVVPFPVLLASSISQDGHVSIPLLAESRKSFLWAKAINCAVALAAGFAAMLIM